jgi:arsenite/tail-anchored protein-transporting ATPase
MEPRTILYTGKGGVGKTSIATATARRCAAEGARTIVLSTDPAHSLAESLETRVGGEPTDVGGGLFAQQVLAQDELERHWSGVQRWLGGVLMERGVDRIAAEELTVPPGGDELFSLLALKAHHESGDWDVIVVDCAPTGETLRLLSFPDAAQWWLDKVFGRERALLAAARPLARTFLDLQLPDDRAFGEIQGLVANLVAMHDLLRDAEHASIRLVMTPDRMVVAEAMRTFTYLNLYGYVTDAVVVNRVFPDEVEGTYFGAWRAVQAEQLELVESGFAPVPVLRAPYFEREVLGPEMLDRLGDAVFAGRDAGAVLHDRVTQELSLHDGGAELRLDLPFVSKGDVSLKKIGLELVVRVDGQKRTILLPGAMAAYRPASAVLADGSLVVGFTEQEPARAWRSAPGRPRGRAARARGDRARREARRRGAAEGLRAARHRRRTGVP